MSTSSATEVNQCGCATCRQHRDVILQGAALAYPSNMPERQQQLWDETANLASELLLRRASIGTKETLMAIIYGAVRAQNQHGISWAYARAVFEHAMHICCMDTRRSLGRNKPLPPGHTRRI